MLAGKFAAGIFAFHISFKLFPKPLSRLDLRCVSSCSCLQEWKARGPPASTVGRLTEIPTGDLLHPVSKEPTHKVLLKKKKKKSCLVALFTTFSSLTAGADKKAEAGAGAATEFQFVSIDFCFQL